MPIRLAMLGMWHTHADGMVRQVTEHPKEFTLVGFFDRDADVVAQRRKQWAPRLENLRLARLALEHSKPVLLEKPAGDNLDEFRRLIDQAQRKHLHVQMIYLFRYMAAVEEMLQRIRKGELGRIYHYRARLPKDLPSYARVVEELAPYTGGMFFEMAGHVIDMM